MRLHYLPFLFLTFLFAACGPLQVIYRPSSNQSRTVVRSTASVNLPLLTDQDDGESIWAQSLLKPDGEGGDIAWAGNFGAGPIWYYARFRLTENIPPLATIDHVKLNIHGVAVWNWDDNQDSLDVYLQDTADAPAVMTFDDTVDAINGNLKTTAVVRWPEVGGLTWQISATNSSPNLAPLLQELVDRYGGLTKDSYVQFWIRSTGATDPEVGIADYGHSDFDTSVDIIWSY